MSTIEVNTINPQSGNDITIGGSSKNVKFASGTTVDFSTNTPTLTLGAAMKNTPAFQAYLGAKQTVSSGTTTKINLNTEVFDSDSMYDASTNYRFTPTIAGKYFCFLNVELSWDSGYGDVGEAEIQKNGSSALRTRFILQTGTDNGFYGVQNVSGILDFNGSSDYIEGYAKYDGSSPFFVQGSNKTFFGAYRIIGA